MKGCQPSGYSQRTVFPLHAASPGTARLVCQGLFPPLCSSSTTAKGSGRHRQLISSCTEPGLALAKPRTTCTRVKLRFPVPALFLLPRKHVLTPRSLIYLRSHHVQLIALGNKHEEAAAQAGTPANKQHLWQSQPRGAKGRGPSATGSLPPRQSLLWPCSDLTKGFWRVVRASPRDRDSCKQQPKQL